MGVVGESGCGKSTLGKCMIRLHKPTSGSVYVDGKNTSRLGWWGMKKIRSRMQMIFQDPNSSLNPRMTVETAVKEVIKLHKAVPAGEIDARIDALLTKVGLRRTCFRVRCLDSGSGPQPADGFERGIGPDDDVYLA